MQIKQWSNVDCEDFALTNIELLTHLIGKCEDLHDIDPTRLSFVLDNSVMLLRESIGERERKPEAPIKEVEQSPKSVFLWEMEVTIPNL